MKYYYKVVDNSLYRKINQRSDGGSVIDSLYTFEEMKRHSDNIFTELCSQALNETINHYQMTVHNSGSENGAIPWNPEKDFE